MPRKFRRVLRKGYSKTKSAKAIAKAQQSGDSDATGSEEKESAIPLISTTSGVESFVEASTQTNLHVSHHSTDISSEYLVSTREMSTQTDLCGMQLNTSESSTQTDVSAFTTNTCTVCTQTEDTAIACQSTSQSIDMHQSGKRI